MFVQKVWTMMSLTLTDKDACELVEREENARCALRIAKRPEVRAGLARDIGIAPGTIEVMRRRRFKSLKTHVRDSIKAWMIRGLQHETRKTEHELFLALQCGESPNSDAVVSAQAAMAAAREALSKAVRP